MSTSLSKYAENQFDTATIQRFPLMGELLVDAGPRIAAAAALHAELIPGQTIFTTASTAWTAGEMVLANAEASGLSTTFFFDDKMSSLTRQPDSNTPSVLDSWVATLTTQAIPGSGLYIQLLPYGRATLTNGTREAQLDAGQAFGMRLAAQVSKPTLVSLGILVTTFYTAARALRLAQTNAKTALDNARISQEVLRVNAANALYGVTGLGMFVWSGNSPMVDTLYDINLLRSNVQNVPAPPADTTWTPGTRTLSTTALPAEATRLEAWREGSGGMPELLAVGLPGETSITLPNTITFHTGEPYQLWLQARNSRGTSAPGPVQNWTAP